LLRPGQGGRIAVRLRRRGGGARTIEDLITRYGYWIVLLGTFFEGETVLLMAGFAAHRGYLRLEWVIAAAFAGSLAGDQVIFHLGRRWGVPFLERRPRWKARAERVHALMERWRDAYIVVFRFLYGLRTVSPFVLGTSRVSSPRFLALNAVGAALWATVLALAGYLLGGAMEVLLVNVRQIEIYVLVAIALAGVAARVIWRVRGK
jgi:membrane protein DedA with SNARE-associated domain